MSSPRFTPILDLEKLNVYFKTEQNRRLHAIRDLDLDVYPGEIMGLVGESGSGKSVTCLSVMGLLGPRAIVEGQVMYHDQNLLTHTADNLEKLRGGRLAMIFQDPITSLNPVHTIGRQIIETLELHQNLSRRDAKQEAIGLLRRVGISAAAQRLREYPHQLSGGMCQRVMIAMALGGKPDILIADEPTTALDVTIQAQILTLIRSLSQEYNTTVILITHDLGVVAELCDRMAVMYGGRIIEVGTVKNVFAAAKHPYTQGLLHSLPKMDDGHQRLIPIRGTVPSLHDMPLGCAFNTRCEYVMNICHSDPPKLKAIDSSEHRSACYYTVEKIAA
jgi:oligopeptide/dipeptide ABC transporter ATP-binding protein